SVMRCLCHLCISFLCLYVVFFVDSGTLEIYTLSLHDALPILDQFELCRGGLPGLPQVPGLVVARGRFRRGLRAVARAGDQLRGRDRKSTRLNSSHVKISYAVFCLKKKKTNIISMPTT